MRLTQIDESHWGDHPHLCEADDCFFLREYTSGQGFDFSETNRLISNLKKSPSKRGRPEWKYKEKAISQAARELSKGLTKSRLSRATFVPVPPSKMRADPEYDDRMVQVCQRLGSNVDVRELVYQTETTRASHNSSGNRVTVDELLEVYAIDNELIEPTPTAIAIVDDMLTTGTHFRAMHNLLASQFPRINIIGLFIARRVFV